MNSIVSSKLAFGITAVVFFLLGMSTSYMYIQSSNTGTIPISYTTPVPTQASQIVVPTPTLGYEKDRLPWANSTCGNNICERCESTDECCNFPCVDDACPPPSCEGGCPQDCQVAPTLPQAVHCSVDTQCAGVRGCTDGQVGQTICYVEKCVNGSCQTVTIPEHEL